MCLCGDVLYIQIKKWYVKFGATDSLKTFMTQHLGSLKCFLKNYSKEVLQARQDKSKTETKKFKIILKKSEYEMK